MNNLFWKCACGRANKECQQICARCQLPKPRKSVAERKHERYDDQVKRTTETQQYAVTFLMHKAHCGHKHKDNLGFITCCHGSVVYQACREELCPVLKRRKKI